MTNNTFYALISLSLFACGEKSEDTAVDSFDVLAEFESQLTGRFDSLAQSLVNPSYYDVQLQACAVEAPELGEHVLYIEQALLSNVESPYRQRLYVLSTEADGTVRSIIYTVSNEGSRIGLCNLDEVVTFDVGSYEERIGCDVVLTYNGIGFDGSTEEGACPSDMNGATYATSVVSTTPDEITSWDQGWNDNGQQMWGAVDGAYVFQRRE
jgi:CpeT protein